MHSLNTAVTALGFEHVRVLAVSPPSFYVYSALIMILDYIAEGASKEFDVMDANRVKRKVFLDVIGILKDTPALNAAIDFMGHTALACCYLCGFSKQPTTYNTIRFPISTHIIAVAAAQSSETNHKAIKDCSPTGSVLRSLGIKKQKAAGIIFCFIFIKAQRSELYVSVYIAFLSDIRST